MPRRSPLPRALPAALLLAVLAGCSPVRTIEAASLLADIAGGTPEAPARVEAVYEGAAEQRRGHLYPPVRSRAALVVVPGAAEQAMDDPRLVAFAGALSRRGFLVLVPRLGEDHLQVSADDAEAVADAVRHLAEAGQVEEVGLAALSYAVGPTIQAALREDLRNRIGYIVSIGGYYDIAAGITYITTGAFRDAPDAAWRYGAIDRRAKWLFLQANLQWVDDPADARLLETIARTRLQRPDADVAPLAAQLGPEGRAVFAVFADADPDRVPALIAALPPRLRREIAALDLAALDLGGLRARLILIHGRDDPLVPYTESLKLARAVGPERSSLHLLRGLDHVTLGTPGLGDLGTLLGAAYRVLAERDAAPAPAVVAAGGDSAGAR